MPTKTRKPTDKILAKAKRILKERTTQSERIETCLQADICPNCGEPGDPKRRDDNVIYRFTCMFCHARYVKRFGTNDQWKETLPYQQAVPETKAKPKKKKTKK